MVLNPFIEGIIVIVLAAATMVLSHIYAAPELMDLGKTLVGVGIGYMGGTAVQRAQS